MLAEADSTPEIISVMIDRVDRATDLPVWRRGL